MSSGMCIEKLHLVRVSAFACYSYLYTVSKFELCSMPDLKDEKLIKT